VKQKWDSEKRLRKAPFSSRCTSSTDTQADDPGVRCIDVQRTAYVVQHLRNAYNRHHTSLTLFGKLTVWRVNGAVSWNRGWTLGGMRAWSIYVRAWETGSLLPLLARVAGWHRRARRLVPLILARGTGWWLILTGRWASGRRILARRRPGGRWVARIGWKVWKRKRVRVWRRVLALDTSRVWEPAK
jgi:hypothetical protein